MMGFDMVCSFASATPHVRRVCRGCAQLVATMGAGKLDEVHSAVLAGEPPKAVLARGVSDMDLCRLQVLMRLQQE
jgi:hypothetical protein